METIEQELAQHRELKERFDEQTRMLASKMELNEEFSLKIINLERDLGETRELRRTEVSKVKNELKEAQDYAEALILEKAEVAAKLAEVEEQAKASKVDFERTINVKDRTSQQHLLELQQKTEVLSAENNDLRKRLDDQADLIKSEQERCQEQISQITREKDKTIRNLKNQRDTLYEE